MTAHVTLHNCSPENWDSAIQCMDSSYEIFLPYPKISCIHQPLPPQIQSIGFKEAFTFMNLFPSGASVQHFVSTLIRMSVANNFITKIHIYAVDDLDLLRLLLSSAFYVGGFSTCTCKTEEFPPLPLSPCSTMYEGRIGLGIPNPNQFDTPFRCAISVLGDIGEQHEGDAVSESYTPVDVHSIMAPNTISELWQEAESPNDTEESVEDDEVKSEKIIEKTHKKRHRGKRGGRKK